MGTNKKYWKGLEELHQEPDFLKRQENEFPQDLPVEEFLNDEKLDSANTSRRDFLKFLGFSVSAATLAACEAPVIRSIPYLEKPEEVVAGIANWYTSTFYDGNDYANVLVKTREGRPIFIGQNPVCKIGGNVNARVTASVLSLYDTQRLKQPLKDNKIATWEEVDREIIKKLNGIAASGGKIRLLTNTVISPSTRKAIETFAQANADNGGDFKHVTYDSISYNGIRLANMECFGKGVIPSYHFEKAKVVVSVGADFFNNWVYSNKWLGQYLQTRKPENPWMSRHFQFESHLSLTGSNADVREPIKPSEEGLVLASILKQLGGSVSLNTSAVDKQTKQAAKELKKNAGKSLVISGSNNPALQVLTNQINVLLENYGETIDLNNHLNVKQGNDAEVRQLVNEMGNGQVDALIIYGVNPAYNLFNAEAFKAGLKKVKLSISLSGYADETGVLCNYACPDNHYLESWNDFNPQVNKFSLAQPTISKLYNTRQGQESLLTWTGLRDVNFHEYIQKYWREELFSNQSEYLLFDEFWNQKLHDGFTDFDELEASGVEFNGDVNKALSEVNKLAKKTGDFEVVFYQKESIGDGSQIGNPWLQELPDPITKVTWDNYVTMAMADVRNGGYNTSLGQEKPASMVKVTINDKTVELPVCPSPGQKQGTIGIALGYGRGANGEKVGKASFQFTQTGEPSKDENNKLVSVGKNAFQFTTYQNGAIQYHDVAKVEKMDMEYPLACTQTQHTFMGRTSVVRETTFEEYKLHDAENTYNPPHTLPVHEHGETVDKPVSEIDLWDAHPVENVGHRWGMSIDLNTCIGCSACVVACHAENNVPVVGKDEVRRGRDMHWLRIDRYYSSEEEPAYFASKGGDKSADFSYKDMEVPEDQPKVVHMPMMCQHCNHAGCETVCPVAATTHSNEGLNQMTYNRCIGTRYCANNCPYKVRRFNWFNYTAYKKFKHVNPSQDDLARMVLNPDVAVRTRGVMEKCSMCVQRIQAGKLVAKKEGRKVEDGEIKTACAAACPTDAIIFGDLNDKMSQVAHKSKDERAYRAIEEVGSKPNIYYLAKVRNESEA